MRVHFISGFCLVLITSCFGINAQTLRINAGLNLSTMTVATDEELKINPGLHLGATAEFPISKSLSFEPGLFLSPKGFTINGVEVTIFGLQLEEKYIFNPIYADILLNAKAVHQTGEVRLFFTSGPYVGIGIGGKAKLFALPDGKSRELLEQNNIVWGSFEDNDGLRRLDFGLCFGAGFEISAFLFEIFYELGLTNNYHSTDSWKNRVLGISLGFRVSNF